MTIMHTIDQVWEKVENQTPELTKTVWGAYIKHTEREDKSYWVKTLIIESGHQLSLQYHNKRTEFWYICDDHAYYEITVDKDKYIAKGKRIVHIPVGYVHTIRNMSGLPLIILETAVGTVEETDIVRLYDPYADKR